MILMRVLTRCGRCLAAVAAMTVCFYIGHVIGGGVIVFLLACSLAGVLAAGLPRDKTEQRLVAGTDTDAEGKPKAFTLSAGQETVVLEPGKAWIKVDHYKWVARGLIEGPQSYHVLSDGTVQINAERIALADPEAVTRLEHEINKKHTPAAPRELPAAEAKPTADLSGRGAQRGGKVRFKVKLDHLGHLTIEAARGAEKFETGLRGLSTFAVNGLMIKPGRIHVDPLQRSIEIDGHECECTTDGARHLEELLNSNYAPVLQANQEEAIEIKDNPAAPTGFDIAFTTGASGVRLEVKGHLSQEKLDLLQDPARCDLLRHGILLRLSPPHLIVRRRRPDGGEERIPELPDIPYRQVTAAQLAHILNNPLLRQTEGKAGPASSEQAGGVPSEIMEIRLGRNPQTRPLLWLECLLASGKPPLGKAFTHHNLADLQHSGVFLPHLDVSLSLDHRTLGILNQASGQEESITIDAQSSDEDLAKASRLLTVALKRPAAPLIEPSVAPPPPAPPPPPTPDALPSPPQTFLPRTEASPVPDSGQVSPVPLTANPQGRAEQDMGKAPTPIKGEASPRSAPVPPAAAAPRIQSNVVEPEAALSPIQALFRKVDLETVAADVFRALQRRLDITIQDLLLSLPRVFEDRRFEVLSFQELEITSVLELRSEEFYGFYLSHVSDRKTLLVYACQGRHIEWGASRCLLEGSVAAEPNEFRHGALLGMAQDLQNRFVFVVTPDYREWVRPHERLYLEVSALFRTVADLDARPEDYVLIWPEKAAEEPSSV